MKTYTQLIEELYEAAVVNTALINHHGHEMALARTRNMLNPQLAARKEKDKHIETLKSHGVVVDKYGGVSHPDSEADKALNTGLASGSGAEYEAQPNVRHGESYATSINPRTSAKLRREVGDFTGLDAYRMDSGKHN